MKKVADSAIPYHAHQVFPNDLNGQKTVFGGRAMELADRLAAVVAQRHSQRMCVTLSVDSMRFLAPVREGETLVFKSAVNHVWNTSMEVGVKVMAVNFLTNEERHVVSAYFTFVALDENGKPTQIEPIVPETDEEKRRYEEAGRRRQVRLQNP
ncbi:MAG: acyl-CoA thioesterase [Patescibacteria group bacterium]